MQTTWKIQVKTPLWQSQNLYGEPAHQEVDESVNQSINQSNTYITRLTASTNEIRLRLSSVTFDDGAIVCALVSLFACQLLAFKFLTICAHTSELDPIFGTKNIQSSLSSASLNTQCAVCRFAACQWNDDDLDLI